MFILQSYRNNQSQDQSGMRDSFRSIRIANDSKWKICRWRSSSSSGSSGTGGICSRSRVPENSRDFLLIVDVSEPQTTARSNPHNPSSKYSSSIPFSPFLREFRLVCMRVVWNNILSAGVVCLKTKQTLFSFRISGCLWLTFGIKIKTAVSKKDLLKQNP